MVPFWFLYITSQWILFILFHSYSRLRNVPSLSNFLQISKGLTGLGLNNVVLKLLLWQCLFFPWVWNCGAPFFLIQSFLQNITWHLFTKQLSVATSQIHTKQPYSKATTKHIRIRCEICSKLAINTPQQL